MRLKAIFRIALALMFGGVIITGIYTLNQEGVQPREDQITETIRQDIGTTTVTIGAPPNDNINKAQEEMEALIAWNSLAASHCQVLAASHVMSGIEMGELATDEISPTGNPLTYAIDQNRRNMNGWVNGYEFENETTGNLEYNPPIVAANRNAVFGFEAGYEPLIEAGFTKECLGSQSVIKKIEDTVKSAGGGLLSGFGKMVAIGGSALALTACAVATGGVCGAVALGIVGSGTAVTVGAAGAVAGTAAYLSGQNMLPPSRDLAKEVGFDMEGRPGRINFESNRTFHLGTEYPEPIIGMNFKGGDWKVGSTGFWRGQRFMYAVPPGLHPETNYGWKCCSIEPPGDNVDGSNWGNPFGTFNRRQGMRYADSNVAGGSGREVRLFDGFECCGQYSDGRKKHRTFYAWRVRMINQEKIEENYEKGEEAKPYNIPLAATHPLSPEKLNDRNPPQDGNARNEQIRYLLRNTYWVICNNAEGYVQSNAYKMYNDGESQKDNPKKEDNVFPMIRVTEHAKNCLEPGSAKTIDELPYIHFSESLTSSIDFSKYDAIISDLENAFYNQMDEPAPNFLRCENKSQMGREDTVFSRGQYDGSTFESRFLCGGKPETYEIDEDDGDYGNDKATPASDKVEVYTPKFKLDGCSQAYYDITFDSKNEGDKLVWNHSTTYDYDANEEGLRDQIVYKDLHIRHNSNYRQNKTFGINVSIEGGNNIELIVGEEYRDGDLFYKAVEVTGSDYRKTKIESLSNQRFKLDLKNGDLDILGSNQPYEELESNQDMLDFEQADDSREDMNIKRISVGNVSSERLEEVNNEIGGFDFSTTQGEVSMNEVVTHGSPQICHKAIEE